MTYQGGTAVVTDLTVGDAIRNYISAMKPADRPTSAPVLQAFARWFGSERSIKEIDPVQLERYQEQMSASGQDPANKLEPLRQFLSDARSKKLIDVALASHVKIRRKTALERQNMGRPVEIEKVEVTRAGFEQLQAELVRLEGEELPAAISAMASAAADKDFRENAPLDAAREKQAHLEARIRELETLLKRAVVVETGADASGRARMGSRVRLRRLDNNQEVEYTLVGPGEVDRRGGKISIQSPVGRAFVDRVVGDIVEVSVPAGVHRYRIERIEEGR